jgi:hypothetical protein
MDRSTGLLLVAVGVGVAVLGLLVWSGALSWFGRLPGDIRAEGARGGLYLPITSSIVASVVLTVVLNVLVRLFR